MIPVERQRRILHVLQDQGTLTITELRELLGVSHMTVRRAIGAREELGRVTSVSKGVSLPTGLGFDQSHAVKAGVRQGDKAAIARRAAQMSAGNPSLVMTVSRLDAPVARRAATLPSARESISQQQVTLVVVDEDVRA